MVSITGFFGEENRKTPNRSTFFKVSTIRGSVQNKLLEVFLQIYMRILNTLLVMGERNLTPFIVIISPRI